MLWLISPATKAHGRPVAGHATARRRIVEARALMRRPARWRPVLLAVNIDISRQPGAFVTAKLAWRETKYRSILAACKLVMAPKINNAPANPRVMLLFIGEQIAAIMRYSTAMRQLVHALAQFI